MKNKKIIVGVSGGVDSSVALVLLKQQGWQPIAVTLRLPIWKNKCNALCENVCCTKESRDRARAVCQKLGVPYHIVDSRADFNKNVVDYFTNEYKSGRTPNPCVICNRKLKFKYLFDFAKKHGVKYVATGHYAKISRNKQGEYFLTRAKDQTKDQTYSLSFLKKEWLKNIVFPLADLTKDEVYKIARDNGFNFYEKVKQSQDFCFVSGKALPNFLKTTIRNRQPVSTKLSAATPSVIARLACPEPCRGEAICTGRFSTLDGKIIGKHDGAFLYTIGQRKGIDVPNGPWYVVATNAKNDVVYISKKIKDILKKELIATNVNCLANVKFPIRAKVKIRSTHAPAMTTITKNKNGLRIFFDKPQQAITPGQIAAIYKRNNLLAAGIIS